MDSFVGEIRAFGFNFTPRGWLPCNGQSVPLQMYQVLFAVIGASYGAMGNNNSTFALPNLNGKAPMGMGGALALPVGAAVGVDTVTLDATTAAAHTHELMGAMPAGGASSSLTNGYPGKVAIGPRAFQAYSTGNGTNATMAPNAMGPAGGGTNGVVSPHDNHQPYLTVNYCICYDGIYPPRP